MQLHTTVTRVALLALCCAGVSYSTFTAPASAQTDSSAVAQATDNTITGKLTSIIGSTARIELPNGEVKYVPLTKQQWWELLPYIGQNVDLTMNGDNVVRIARATPTVQTVASNTPTTESAVSSPETIQTDRTTETQTTETQTTETQPTETQTTVVERPAPTQVEPEETISQPVRALW